MSETGAKCRGARIIVCIARADPLCAEWLGVSPPQASDFLLFFPLSPVRQPKQRALREARRQAEQERRARRLWRRQRLSQERPRKQGPGSHRKQARGRPDAPAQDGGADALQLLLEQEVAVVVVLLLAATARGLAGLRCTGFWGYLGGEGAEEFTAEGEKASKWCLMKGGACRGIHDGRSKTVLDERTQQTKSRAKPLERNRMVVNSCAGI